jgi:hypothetical protein
VLNIGKLSPGAADYYVGEVATSAEDYYTGRGETAGRWVGSLAQGIGLEGAVEPEHFRAVLDGRHPFTGERLAPARAEHDQTDRRPGPDQGTLFEDGTVDVARTASRLRVTVGRVRQLLWAGEQSPRPTTHLIGRHALRNRGRPQWRIETAEVERFEAAHLSKKARPGYDLTLRPPKSVSVLWALAPDNVRAEIRQAHADAVDAVVAYVETHALYARRRNRTTHSLERVATDGVIAAAFDHRTSRAGDPLLHSHVVTANLTRTVEGRWQAIDGRPLFDHARPAGVLYQAHLRHLLTTRLGIAWGQVRKGWAEVDGVPREVSGRSRNAATRSKRWSPSPATPPLVRIKQRRWRRARRRSTASILTSSSTSGGPRPPSSASAKANLTPALAVSLDLTMPVVRRLVRSTSTRYSSGWAAQRA